LERTSRREHGFHGLTLVYGIAYDTIMKLPQVVIDTNVLIAALRSQYGASYKLLMLLDSGLFEINLSVPLALEYEDVSQRMAYKLGLTSDDIDDILDYIISVANRHEVHYLWRPFLKDPQDDMVLEIAVASGAKTIVTYNKADFAGVEQFGIAVLTAQEFLQQIGVLP
jgi:putative PIN family toxin of toxin-antitoxin system